MDHKETVVGCVAGTKDSTPLLFHVVIDSGAYLQLDDVVVTVREVSGEEPVMTSGVVTQVSARHEGASFGSDVCASSGVHGCRHRRVLRPEWPDSGR